MGNLIYWVIFFSVIITIGGMLLAPHFLSMVGATDEIKAYKTVVLVIVVLAILALPLVLAVLTVAVLTGTLLLFGAGGLTHVDFHAAVLGTTGRRAVVGNREIGRAHV